MNTYAQSILAKHDKRIGNMTGRYMNVSTGIGCQVLDDNGHGKLLIVVDGSGQAQQCSKDGFLKHYMPCQ